MGVYLMAVSLGGGLGTVINLSYTALGLGFVIFVHELGHFLVAKACGVKCEKFYLGFDIFGLRLCRFRYGETEYGIGALPLGGYVKMLGQDDNPANAETERDRALAAGTAAEGKTGGETVEKKPPEFEPRSYRAKNVPQRMAIISAGVIMNLIFAVILATVAYRMGVTYTPCIIGGTVPGDAAWMQNWEPGTQILQIGRNGYYDEQLRFDKDLRPKIIINGDQPIDLLVRAPGGEEKWITITPIRKEEMRGYASLGTRSLIDLKVSSLGGKHRDEPADKNSLSVGDRILAVNNTPVKIESEYRDLLNRHVDEKITFDVERSLPKEGDATDDTSARQLITVDNSPRAVRWLGIATRPGPIVAVRPGSPAANAGLKAGDRLAKLDGQPIGDPITLAARIFAKLNQPIPVEVERTDESGKTTKLTLTVTPTKPVTPESDDTFGARAAVESIGIAYGLTTEVAEVAPDSPAAKAGLKAGDEITNVEFVPANEESRMEEGKTLRKFKIGVGPKAENWFTVHRVMQSTLADTGIKLTYKRGEDTSTTDSLLPTTYGNWHDPERGIVLSQLNRVRTAESFGEAIGLGFRETSESMGQVLSVLQGIFTGKVKPTDLGGPLSIAATATSEASVGISSLLIFLTLLSANLAIVNFLPIPVLDGGHFVFLAYEGLRGRPPNERVQITLTYCGLAFLLLLMAFVFTLDIHRGFTWLMG